MCEAAIQLPEINIAIPDDDVALDDDMSMLDFDVMDPLAFATSSPSQDSDNSPSPLFTSQRRMSVRNLKIKRAEGIGKVHHNRPSSQPKPAALSKLRESQELQKTGHGASPIEKKNARQLWRFTAKKARKMSDEWEGKHWEEWPIERAVRYRYNYFKQNWSVDNVVVRMETMTFGHGAMRECFRIKKLSNFAKEAWKSPTCNFVSKRYIEDVDRKVYEDDVILQSVAKVWGEIYNLRANVKRKVDICQMCLLEFTERPDSPVYHLESFIPGEYIKYNSNSGFVDYDETKCRNTPHAFSHFTFEFSGHTLIVVDIQGVGDIYTDPQIHTHDGLGFGDGNLGTRGMALFFHSHECNPICKALGLTPFDLSIQEKGESQRLRSHSTGQEESHTMAKHVDVILSGDGGGGVVPPLLSNRFVSHSASRTRSHTMAATPSPALLEECTTREQEDEGTTSPQDNNHNDSNGEKDASNHQHEHHHHNHHNHHNVHHCSTDHEPHKHHHGVVSPTTITAMLSGANAESAARLQSAYDALLNRQLQSHNSHSGHLSAAASQSSCSGFIQEEDFVDSASVGGESEECLQNKKGVSVDTSRQISSDSMCCSPPSGITIVEHPFQGTISPTSPTVAQSFDSGVFDNPQDSFEKRGRRRMESSCSEGYDDATREQMLHQVCEHTRRFSCVSMADKQSCFILAKIHHDLAHLHESGRFLVNREVDLVDWSSVFFHEEKAAELGLLRAIVNLGRYHLGLSTDIFPADAVVTMMPNERKGFAYLMQAANVGHLPSMVFIADAFRQGHSMTLDLDDDEETIAKPDWEAATYWYQRTISGIQNRMEPSDDCDTQEEDILNGLCPEDNVLPDKEMYELQGVLAEMYAVGGHNLDKDTTKAYELYYEAGDNATSAMKGRLAAKFYEAAESIEE